jgi:hypothetical protein
MLAQPSCEQKAGPLGMRKNTLHRVHGVHRGHRAAFAGERIGGGGTSQKTLASGLGASWVDERRGELAGGECVEGAEAGGEFGVG